jgi:DNA-binding cell septation regulator SpoVG
MSAPIEVLRIHRLDGGGAVRAFVDLKVGGLTIFGAKVVQQEGQRAWVGMPSQKSADGKWRPIVVVDSKPLRERISAIVLDAWGRHEVQIIPPAKARGQQAQDTARAALDAEAEWPASDRREALRSPPEQLPPLRPHPSSAPLGASEAIEASRSVTRREHAERLAAQFEPDAEIPF